ncbi:MAG: DUF2970 domain-containing protein [Burkholderiales bacterium]|jgi:hypothetical protein
MPEPASPPPPPEDSPSGREAGFLQVVGAVFWSFFGVRRKAAGERDMVTIKLVHVVIAGLLGAALFVAVLIGLVSYITHHA